MDTRMSYKLHAIRHRAYTSLDLVRSKVLEAKFVVSSRHDSGLDLRVGACKRPPLGTVLISLSLHLGLGTQQVLTHQFLHYGTLLQPISKVSRTITAPVCNSHEQNEVGPQQNP